MKPGEWRRHLAAEQHRAALAGRQWHAQRWIDNAMSGADEVDQNLTRMYVDPAPPLKWLNSRQTFPLSAHWWHG